jgi:hypothetical protein
MQKCKNAKMQKCKLKLNLIQQENGLKTNRIKVDKEFYERLKIDMIGIDFNNEKYKNIDKKIIEKGKTFDVRKSVILFILFLTKLIFFFYNN